MVTLTSIVQAREPSFNQRLVHTDISWQQFKLIQAGFAPSSNVRLFFYKNTLEILMPGREHEFFKSIIGMLIELFCLENEVEFEPLGATTQENAEQAVSAEPDESYCFGSTKHIPDLVVEVVFTSGGPNKLQRYQALQIPEVWFWQDGVLTVYHLGAEGYVTVQCSGIAALAMLDIELLTRCILQAETSRLEAARTFRRGLAGI